MDEDSYKLGAVVTFVLIFLASWAYCTIQYGFLFGFGVGWLPSGILAFILCWFWPLYVLVIAGLVVAYFYFHR